MRSNRFQCGRQGNVEHRGALSNLVGGGGLLCTLNSSPSKEVTVRQTPFTAMLHPSAAPSSTVFALTVSSTPAPSEPSQSLTLSFLTREDTAPISSTIPENIARTTSRRPARNGNTEGWGAYVPRER